MNVRTVSLRTVPGAGVEAHNRRKGRQVVPNNVYWEAYTGLVEASRLSVVASHEGTAEEHVP